MESLHSGYAMGSFLAVVSYSPVLTPCSSSLSLIFPVISVVTPATACFVTQSDYSDLGCIFFSPGICVITNAPYCQHANRTAFI